MTTLETNLHLKFEPRRLQKKALHLWTKDMKGIVSVVTGGGKTVFAFLCILEFFKSFPNGRIIIVVPTRALLDQWHISLQEDLRVRSFQIASYSGDEKPEEARRINLIVINSARLLAKSLSQYTDTCLIVDECHRAGSPENSKALIGNHDAVLGLSATPYRDFDLGFEELIRPKLGDVIYEYLYDDALSEGVISPFVLINVKVPFLSHEEEKYRELTRRIAIESERLRKTQSSRERLEWLLRQRASISATAKNRIPMAIWLAEKHTGERTLVFHERIDAADEIFCALNNRNHQVTQYHTGIGPAIRRDNLRLFRKGVFDQLITCRALDEGLNVPETTIGIIASSTSSKRQRIQRMGRILRPAEGKKAATLYTIYVTDEEERRLLEESIGLQNLVDTKWWKETGL